MRKLWGIGLTAAATAVATAVAGQDVLRWRNGNQLSGRWLAATPAELRWESPAAVAPIAFEPSHLQEVQLGPRPPSRSRQWHSCVVELTNGDRLTGELVTWAPDALTLETWYAGRLTMVPATVRAIRWRSSLPEVVYIGPTGLGEWLKAGTSAAWDYRNGWLYAAGGHGILGRAVAWPALARLDFEAAWQGAAQWQVGVGCAHPGQPGAGGYILNFSGNSVQLYRAFQNSQRPFEESLPLPAVAAARISIRLDRPRQRIALLLNDELIKEWRESREFAGTGPYLVFVTQGAGQLRLGNIRVSQWDGHMDVDESAESPTGDVVILKHRDRLSGQVRAIGGGEVWLSTGFGDLKVPLSQVASVHWAGRSRASGRPPAASVRGFLPDGTRLTVALERFDGQQLRGHSENFGSIAVPVDALTRLEFGAEPKPATAAAATP